MVKQPQFILCSITTVRTSRSTPNCYILHYTQQQKICETAARFEKVADTFPHVFILRIASNLMMHLLIERFLSYSESAKNYVHFSRGGKEAATTSSPIAVAVCKPARVSLRQRFQSPFINPEREQLTDRATKQTHRGICMRIHHAMMQCCCRWIVLKWLRNYRVPCLPINDESQTPYLRADPPSPLPPP
jgi:hypothetical protein